jgi:hypothetical protein
VGGTADYAALHAANPPYDLSYATGRGQWLAAATFLGAAAAGK